MKEVNDILDNAPTPPNATPHAVAGISGMDTQDNSDSRIQLAVSGDCPVCYDLMHQDEDIIFCQKCGNNVHRECWNMLAAAKQRMVVEDLQCLYCGCVWNNKSLTNTTTNIDREEFNHIDQTKAPEPNGNLSFKSNTHNQNSSQSPPPPLDFISFSTAGNESNNIFNIEENPDWILEFENTFPSSNSNLDTNEGMFSGGDWQL